MKEKQGVLQFAAAVMLVAGAACAVVANWEKIVDLFYAIADALEDLGSKRITIPSEYDDYDDADLELL